MSALAITITSVGLSKIVNAQANGTAAVVLSAAGLTASVFVPDPSMTVLPGEATRLDTVSGEAASPDVIHLVISDASPAAYAVNGFGIYDTDGDLFAVYGQATPIVQKAAQAELLLAVDILLQPGAATAVTFGHTNFLNPPATEETVGVVRLATAIEAAACVDDTIAISPGRNKPLLDAKVNKAGDVMTGSLGLGGNLDAATVDGPNFAIRARASATQGGVVQFTDEAASTTWGELVCSSPGAFSTYGFANSTMSGNFAFGGYLDARTVDGANFGVRVRASATQGGAIQFTDPTGGVSWGALTCSAANALTFNGNVVWHAGNFDPTGKADLNSAALTGIPTAPTAAPGTNSQQLATTAFASVLVSVAIAGVLSSPPALLETLKALADAINDDPNFAATMATALGNKADKARQITGGGLLTGGGQFSADQIISLAASTIAQAQAGVDDTTAMTPLKVKAAINQFAPVASVAGRTGAVVLAVADVTGAAQPVQSSLGANGWRWDPNDGYLEQWAVYGTAISSEGEITVQLPVTFDAVYGSRMTVLNAAGANTDNTTVQEVSLSDTTVTVMVQDNAGGSSAYASGFRVFAYGHSAAAPATNSSYGAGAGGGSGGGSGGGGGTGGGGGGSTP